MEPRHQFCFLKKVPEGFKYAVRIENHWSCIANSFYSWENWESLHVIFKSLGHLVLWPRLIERNQSIRLLDTGRMMADDDCWQLDRPVNTTGLGNGCSGWRLWNIKIRVNSPQWPLFKKTGRVISPAEDFYQKVIKINISLGPKRQFSLVERSIGEFSNGERQNGIIRLWCSVI